MLLEHCTEKLKDAKVFKGNEAATRKDNLFVKI